MSKTITPVSLKILDKEYVIACPVEEYETLQASASYLMQKVRDTKESGKVVSNERVVVMSALNIVHEYMRYKKDKDDEIEHLKSQLEHLQSKIDLALMRVKQ